MRQPGSSALGTAVRLAWLVPALVGGQARVATAGTTAAAPRELLLFEETRVSAASKHIESPRDAPARVTVISRQEIEQYGYRTLAEALRAVPGFYLSSDRNYAHIGARGFLRSNDFNDRILLLVNGHAYNNDLYQQAYLGEDFGIDLEAVDHIEVVRGPGSALYGGNAFFAVVNVVTLTGAAAPGIRPLVETGSFARKRGQATAGERLGADADVFASGSVLDVDGAARLFYPAYDTPATHDGIARNADAERALKFFASARDGPLSIQGGTSWREKHIPTGAFGTTFGDPGTKTVDARHFAEVRYDGTSVAQTEITTRLFYDGAAYDGTYVYGSGPTRVKNQDRGESQWFGTEVGGRREVFAGNELTAGVEYTYHPRAVQENFDLPGGRRFLHDARSFATIGVYLQDEWRIAPRVTLVGGLRYDGYYSRLQQVSPRLGTIWTPRESTTVKLLYGEAFRPPNLYELYYALPSAGVRTIPSSGLDSERIRTYEAIVEEALGRGAEATLALYRYDIARLIERVRVADPFFDGVTLQYRNVGGAQANGAEAELRVPLPSGIAARGAYSVQEARDDAGHLLTNSPKHLGRVGVTVPLAYGLTAGSEVLAVGPRRTLTGGHVETATILDVNLVYRTPIDRLRVTAGLYNLLDRTYPDPAGPEHRQDRIAQDGLTFRLQLRYAF